MEYNDGAAAQGGLTVSWHRLAPTRQGHYVQNHTVVQGPRLFDYPHAPPTLDVPTGMGRPIESPFGHGSDVNGDNRQRQSSMGVQKYAPTVEGDCLLLPVRNLRDWEKAIVLVNRLSEIIVRGATGPSQYEYLGLINDLSVLAAVPVNRCVLQLENDLELWKDYSFSPNFRFRLTLPPGKHNNHAASFHSIPSTSTSSSAASSAAYTTKTKTKTMKKRLTHGGAASPRHLKVTVEGRERVVRGGERFKGMWIESGDVTIRRVTFLNCGHSRADLGGAILVTGPQSSVRLKKVTFLKCAAKDGAGLGIGPDARCRAKGCVFLDCVASRHGGAVANQGFVASTASTFNKCIAKGGNGGAMYNGDVASAEIKRCEFRSCFAEGRGGAMFSHATALSVLQDNNWENNWTRELRGRTASFWQDKAVVVDTRLINLKAGRRARRQEVRRRRRLMEEAEAAVAAAQ